ncbi:MAG: DNA recombination protein RmuC [Deltaproteobacteria bacterium]|nr:DNA recombination protein RmuC [Deltaproteobacteria bacterium]
MDSSQLSQTALIIISVLGAISVLFAVLAALFYQRQQSVKMELRSTNTDKDRISEELKTLQGKIDHAEWKANESEREKAVAEDRVQALSQQLEEIKLALKETETHLNKANLERVQAEGEMKAAREMLESEKKLLKEFEEALSIKFKGTAAEALEGANKSFMDLAEKVFAKHKEGAGHDLEARKKSIEGLVKPLQETLERYQVHVRDLEKERQKSYTTIESELKRVIETGTTLSSETRALKDALKKPHVRGRWGEVQLKNCVELAGMSEFADVTFQDANTTAEGDRLIPDMTVRMPGGRFVVVDAKTPTDGFLAALDAGTEELRGQELTRHGRHVKDHVKKLATKEYGKNLDGSADFTVMFLPNESFLYAALETQPDLMEFALEKKILVATPPTLVGLLKVIRYGWNEEKLAQNAMLISDAGQELHKRLADFVEHFVSIGRHLDKAKESYDKGFNSFNRRVLTKARELESLGVKGKKELPEGLGYDLEEPQPKLIASSS